MADDAHMLTLRTADLAAFRAAVIACAEPGERRRCERLLGQLASVEAAANGELVRFAPAGATSVLARRALAHLKPAR
jgi:hypothetical protein